MKTVYQNKNKYIIVMELYGSVPYDSVLRECMEQYDQFMSDISDSYHIYVLCSQIVVMTRLTNVLSNELVGFSGLLRVLYIDSIHKLRS